MSKKMDFRSQLDRHGRLLIPAIIRKDLDYKTGDNFILRVIDGELHVLKLNQVVREVQDMLSQYFSPGESLLEEFLEMRREEFAKESTKFEPKQ